MSETTLVARRADSGERVTIGDLPLETLRALSEARLLRCPVCDGLLVLKAGPVRIHHLAHLSLDDCTAADHEPETDAHRAGKLALYQHFRGPAERASIEQHFPATNQRADVYVESGGACYALEFQQANNSAARWAERHALYQGIGVIDIWFLGQIRFQESLSEPLRAISPYDPRPIPHDVFEAAAGAFRVREMERAILENANAANRLPILYYLDPDTAWLTILLAREVRHSTLRAYRYRVRLVDCALRDGWLWTPLDPLLDRNTL